MRIWQRKLNNIEICNIEYIKNYICEYSYYFYKLGNNKNKLVMFFHKLPYSININIEEK